MTQKTKQASRKTIKLTANATLVLHALLDRANSKTGECFPSIKTIAKDTNLSKSSVQRGLKELLTAGVIVKKARFKAGSGAQTSNLYTIVRTAKERMDAAVENTKKLLKDKEDYIKNRLLAIEERRKQVSVDEIFMPKKTLQKSILHMLSLKLGNLNTPLIRLG